MEQAKEFFAVSGESAGCKSEERVHLLVPPNHVGVNLPFPRSYVRGTKRKVQPILAAGEKRVIHNRGRWKVR